MESLRSSVKVAGFMKANGRMNTQMVGTFGIIRAHIFRWAGLKKIS